MTVHSVDNQPQRSKAWVYYSILATLSFIGGFAHPIGFLGMVLFGLYAYYLHQGGRIVIWFW